MNPSSLLTRSDYEDYLVYLYFDTSTSYLVGCINRAYRDFNRTLRGLRTVETKDARYVQAPTDTHPASRYTVQFKHAANDA
jgi:hypothetical protein